MQVQVQNQQRCQLSNLSLTPTATLEVHHPWQLSVCTTKNTKTQTLCLVAPPTTNTVQVQVQNKQGHQFWVTPTHHWHPHLHLRCIIQQCCTPTTVEVLVHCVDVGSFVLPCSETRSQVGEKDLCGVVLSPPQLSWCATPFLCFASVTPPCHQIET